MEGSERNEDRKMDTNIYSEQTSSANASESHRPQDDFRNEIGDGDGFGDTSFARSNAHDETAAPPSSGSPASDRLEVQNHETIYTLESVTADTDDENVESENEDSDISELIRLASAAAVRDASRMKKSDSDLSESSNENDGDDEILEELLEEDISVRQQQNQQQLGYSTAPPQRSMSSKYMEQASYEASLVEDGGSKRGRTQLKPSGFMGRMTHRTSSLGIIDIDGIEEEGGVGILEGDGESTGDAAATTEDNTFYGSRRQSEFETFRSLKSLSNINVSKDSYEETNEERKEEEEWKDSPRSKPDSSATESSSMDSLLTNLLTDRGINETIYSGEGDQEILLLHALFDGFCRPPLPMDSVRQIVESERKRDGSDEMVDFIVPLPMGVVIQRPCDMLLNLLASRLAPSACMHLEKLPPIFVSSLFRILLRLLEGYTDSQYDSCVILASCPWHNEAPARERKPNTPQNESSAGAKTPSVLNQKLFVGTTNDATANANLMYSVVRLRMNWKNPIKFMLLTIESILLNQEQHQKQDKSYLVFPMIRLVGILCAGGVAVEELRQMISIASDTRLPVGVSLLMTRALSVAASTTAPATITPRSLTSSLVVLGKTSPLNFFSFNSGPGITRTISLDDQQQAPWPFRNDFGAAFNFRVEDFTSPLNKGTHFVLLQALNETGSGIEISLAPLLPQGENCGSQQSTVAVLTIKAMENHKVVSCSKVNNCPLHAKVWYHVALRHTRSRLKGVFSLSSREQLTVLLDGKVMLNEAMKFPHIKQNFPLKQTLSFHVGRYLDGQLGSIYIFRENVSDATLKALFELTSSESTGSINGTKLSRSKRSGEVVHQSHQTNETIRQSSRNIQWDDLEHMALSHHCRSSIEEGNMTRNIADLDENEEKFDANNPLSKSSFSSRLYISWNPCRKENNFLMELHSGAHVSLDYKFVEAVCIENAQRVIGSIGGVQILLPVFRSTLSDNSLEITEKKESPRNNEITIYSLVPDLLTLLSCFVRGNYQNARELMRCGGIDIVEQLLFENKVKCMNSTTLEKYSIFRSIFVFPTLSKLLVETLVEFRISCSHCTALEKKVFSALLFNFPLWFEWRDRDRGVSLYRFFLPTLSYIVQDDPVKVRDCVGATSMISYVRNIVETSVSSFSVVVSYYIVYIAVLNMN